MAIKKEETVSKNVTEEAGYEAIGDRVDRMSKLVKNPEFIKIINEIIAQPESKRQEFTEKTFDRDELNKRGIMLKGNKVKFKPLKGEKGAQKRIVNMVIRIPNVGAISLRGKY
jgi:hypothetical protein